MAHRKGLVSFENREVCQHQYFFLRPPNRNCNQQNGKYHIYVGETLKESGARELAPSINYVTMMESRVPQLYPAFFILLSITVIVNIQYLDLLSD